MRETSRTPTGCRSGGTATAGWSSDFPPGAVTGLFIEAIHLRLFMSPMSSPFPLIDFAPVLCKLGALLAPYKGSSPCQTASFGLFIRLPNHHHESPALIHLFTCCTRWFWESHQLILLFIWVCKGWPG